LEPVIDGGDLRIVVIAGRFEDMCGVPYRRVVASSFPEAKMLQLRWQEDAD
jgi:hypothetical protein